MASTDTSSGQRQFPCRQCGANLVFEPGQTCLKCPYCQTENEIAIAAAPIEELDFYAALADRSATQLMQETITVKCVTCGAESSLSPDVTSDRCPFCGSAIVAQGTSSKQIKPKSLLPFYVKREQAMESFRQWIRSLWFAPSELIKYAEAGGLKGVYLPYWTYDSEADSYYTGERGDNYTDIETYTAYENGRAVTRTRTVTKIRWRPVSGRVQNSFDDVLVLASHSLPQKYIEELEPWDLQNLMPYGDEFLAGFVAESYQVDLEQGFERAKEIMAGTIEQTIRADIGGDHQRIHSVNTTYREITFKHVLLPVWISAYRYREKVYRFMVNARTGEVCGERPYSAWKITFAVLLGLLLVGIIIWFVNNR
jgi:DNA-directed RNA polymerase subunit RPC12/RpoP